MSGLDSTGYTPLRSADYLTIIREAFVADLLAAGLSAEVDWTADTVLGSLTAAMALQLGRLGELAQAIYDGRVPANATGAQLDDLCTLVGIARLDPTASTAVLTLTGTSGTVIPAGAIVQGGGEDGLARWIVQSSVTLSGGTGSADVTCEEEGAIAAQPDEITQIVTPVSGWTAATNPDAATTGRDMETDAALRVRRAESLLVNAGGSTSSIRAGILALDFVVNCIVVENVLDVSAVVSGVTLDARSVGVIVWPNTITADEQDQIAEVIYRRLPAGISTTGSDVVVEVSGADEEPHTITFDFADELSVDVDITVVLAAGYALVDLETLIEEAAADFFTANAVVGGIIDDADVEEYIRDNVAGIRRITVTLNGDVTVEPDANEIPAIGTVTVGV